jgi:hypothetical protein
MADTDMPDASSAQEKASVKPSKPSSGDAGDGKKRFEVKKVKSTQYQDST